MRKIPKVTDVSKITSPAGVSIGMDLGDRRSHVCVLDAAGVVSERFVLDSTAPAMEAAFSPRRGATVAIEAGVLQSRSGEIAGVEVKASATVGERDFAELRWLEARTGAAFAGGVVLYTGERRVVLRPRRGKHGIRRLLGRQRGGPGFAAGAAGAGAAGGAAGGFGASSARAMPPASARRRSTNPRRTQHLNEGRYRPAHPRRKHPFVRRSRRASISRPWARPPLASRARPRNGPRNPTSAAA